MTCSATRSGRELIAEIKEIVPVVNAKMLRADCGARRARAVVLDTLNKVAPAMDEINGKEVGTVMTRLKGLELKSHRTARSSRALIDASASERHRVWHIREMAT